MGKKKQPTYRVVAAESRRARSGAFLEIVGTYQPRGLSIAEPEMVLKIDNDKVLHWLQHGAQPTERVAKLLKVSGALEAFEASKTDGAVAAAPVEKAAKAEKVEKAAKPVKAEVAPAEPVADENVADETVADEPVADEAVTDDADKATT
jgi:small subunit ribosomal protein S16